jgi:hypothetical protein
MIGRTSPVPPQPLVPSDNLDHAAASPMPGRFPAAESAAASGLPASGATGTVPAATSPQGVTPAGGTAVQVGVPSARKPLGSEQPEEWNGQGRVRKFSN